MKQAVLSIYYVDGNGQHFNQPQGKFYYQNGKPIYLVNTGPNRWWRNYGGYSIPKQVLDAFSKAKIRPAIIYREKEKAMIYTATMTIFKKKGVLVAYGAYPQYVLPINNWTVKNISFGGEPFNLPVMPLTVWLKAEDPEVKATPGPEDYEFVGNTAILKPTGL